VYRWFTEGFDTLDLKEAKASLEERRGSSSASKVTYDSSNTMGLFLPL
jgi:hypothetical protein